MLLNVANADEDSDTSSAAKSVDNPALAELSKDVALGRAGRLPSLSFATDAVFQAQTVPRSLHRWLWSDPRTGKTRRS
jgi:hypothetical protein